MRRNKQKEKITSFKCPKCEREQPIIYLMTESGICFKCDTQIYNETITEESTAIEVYQHKKSVVKTETLKYLYGLVLGTIAEKNFKGDLKILNELLTVEKELKEILNA